MNGTSIDGADFVLIEVNKKNLSCRYLGMQSFRFAANLKSRLLAAAQHNMKVDELAKLHHDLGRYYAACFRKLKPNLKKAEVIGLHGQTVFHQGGVASLQIGESSYLAEVSGLPVVSDFRAADIALGGQGAPIATFFHERVFGRKNALISVHNLGGISNLSLIQNGKLKSGFDTGPANMLLDMAIRNLSSEKQQYDRNGSLARRGIAKEELVKKMLQHQFFRIKPPKSCGREEFGEVFYRQHKTELHRLAAEDRLATLTEFVARSIAQAYRQHLSKLPSEIIFCGGGARNVFLLERIGYHLPQVQIRVTEDYGWPDQSIEGAAFACMAAAKVLNKNSNLPHSTGASRAVSLGKITQV